MSMLLGEHTSKAMVRAIPQHPNVDEETIVSTAFSTYLSAAFEDPVKAWELYDRCSQAFSRYVQISPQDDTKRVLEAFITHLPVAGRITLIREIEENSANARKLRQLRNFLVDALLKPARNVGLQSLTISPGLAEEFEDDIDTAMINIDPSSRNQQSVVREKCMIRDGCVVTRAVDNNHFYTKLPADQRFRIRDYLECAHILPLLFRNFDISKPLEVSLKPH